MTEFEIIEFEKEIDDVLLVLDSEASEVQVVISNAETAPFVIVDTRSRQVKLFSYPVRLQALLFPGLTVLSLKQKTKYLLLMR
jgi:hypothetical protein